MLVCESLDRFMMLNEDFLAENVLNEKLDINAIKDYGKKVGVLTSMFLMFAGGTRPELVNKLPDKEKLANSPMMLKMAGEDYLQRDDIFTGFRELLDQYKETPEPEVATPEIFSAGEKGFIDAINRIKPGRLDSAKIARYDKYDSAIMDAVKKLESKGEDVNQNLIKAIMLIETGMNPSKNSLGYEGFPQTKEHILNGWKDDSTGVFHPGINQRYKTNFTMADMYDAAKSAEFIHYYLKSTARSKYVQDVKDLIIAYNWGLGNLVKHKKGEKEMPEETADYINMMNAMQGYFAS